MTDARIYTPQTAAVALSPIGRRGGILLQGLTAAAYALTLAVEPVLTGWLGDAARLPALGLAVALDWLVLSPLLLARHVYFFNCAAQHRPPAFSVGVPTDRTQEFVPPAPSDVGAALRRCFGRQFGQALGWRLKWWVLQAGTLAVYTVPAAVLWRMSEAVVALAAPWNSVFSLFCALLAVLLLPIGAVCAGLRLMRYLPAGCLLAAGHPSRGCFRRARRLTRRRSASLLPTRREWLTLVSGILFVPYLTRFPDRYYARTLAILQLHDTAGRHLSS